MKILLQEYYYKCITTQIKKITSISNLHISCGSKLNKAYTIFVINQFNIIQTLKSIFVIVVCYLKPLPLKRIPLYTCNYRYMKGRLALRFLDIFN